MLDVLMDRKSDLLTALIEHIELSFIALFFAVLIGLPLSIYLTRHRKIAEPIINVAAVLQTIPSLALLGLMIPLFGIGQFPAIVALVAYALLPIMRNTYTGIAEVDPSLIEAADGLGMSRFKRLTKIELPLALSVIMAGIRTAMVLIVGTTTLAALIGAGGLGDLILLGIDRNNGQLILLGAIPAAILALIFDFGLRGIGKLSYKKSLIAFIVIILIALAIVLAPLFNKSFDDTLVIGGKLGAEPEILINMYQILIEDETDLKVELEPGLGKTSFVFNALQSGDIDIYPEFTGTAINEFLKEEVESKKDEEVYEQARSGMLEEFGLVYLPPMAYNNTYTLAVKESLAEEEGLEDISDLDKVKDDLTAGFTLEFSDREDGYLGIQSLYGIEFGNVVTMEPKLRYTAIENGDIDVLDAYSTDSELESYELAVLNDDESLFPPYEGAPLLREETLEEHPELEDILNQLAGKVTDDEMREMNYLVNVEEESPKDVAVEYLKNIDLIE